VREKVDLYLSLSVNNEKITAKYTSSITQLLLHYLYFSQMQQII